MSKRFFTITCVLFVATFFAAQSFAALQLTYSHMFPPTHVHSKLMADWAKEVEKRNDGRIMIQMFPCQTLVKGSQMYDGVLNGITDIGMSLFAYTRGRFPIMEVADLPLGSPSGVVSSKMIKEVFETLQPNELDGVKVMYITAHGPGLVHTKDKPVRTLEDLKGLKLRATGFSAKLVSALGGTPVAMPMPETYQALSKGVVDGATFPYEAGKGFRLFDTIKYTTESQAVAYASGFYVVMNKDRWNSIDPADQKIIEGINNEWFEMTAETWDKIDIVGREFAKEKGVESVTLAPEEVERWKKAVAPVVDEYIKHMADKSFKGKKIVDLARNAIKKYSGM